MHTQTPIKNYYYSPRENRLLFLFSSEQASELLARLPLSLSLPPSSVRGRRLGLTSPRRRHSAASPYRNHLLQASPWTTPVALIRRASICPRRAAGAGSRQCRAPRPRSTSPPRPPTTTGASPRRPGPRLTRRCVSLCRLQALTRGSALQPEVNEPAACGCCCCCC